jgi:hypothetical protein
MKCRTDYREYLSFFLHVIFKIRAEIIVIDRISLSFSASQLAPSCLQVHFVRLWTLFIILDYKPPTDTIELFLFLIIYTAVFYH